MSIELLEKAIELMSYGLTPELIQEHSRQMHIEFEKFVENNESVITEGDEHIAFRSYICHKVATMDLTIRYLLDQICSLTEGDN